jgi:isoprenylcysteine carboxyl methyltransferase (ICMT) family protein YpbQ
MRRLPLLLLPNRLVLSQIIQLLRAQWTSRIRVLDRSLLLIEAGPRRWWNRPVE